MHACMSDGELLHSVLLTDNEHLLLLFTHLIPHTQVRISANALVQISRGTTLRAGSLQVADLSCLYLLPSTCYVLPATCYLLPPNPYVLTLTTCA